MSLRYLKLLFGFYCVSKKPDWKSIHSMRWFLCGSNWIKSSVKPRVWSSHLLLPLSLSWLAHPSTIKLCRKRNLITWLEVAVVSTIKRIQLKSVRRWQQQQLSAGGLFVEVEFDLSLGKHRALAERPQMDGQWEGLWRGSCNWIQNLWSLESKWEKEKRGER